MIPAISQTARLVKRACDFLDALKQHGFNGDTATRYADRLAMATDNSVYQMLPDAVVFPRSTHDVALIARLAAEEHFTALTFTPRGGGTGTNGQSLNTGIVVDMSRYMKRIMEINLKQGWVRVEAGVIKDQLNQYLRPFGYFFAPELSTSNRATLGGMINTDASGQGSLVYGKTSEYVLGLRAVRLGGELIDTRAMPTPLAEMTALEKTAEGRIYHQVLKSCRDQRALILEKSPKLNRFLTGYDLRHVLSDDLQTFDLTRILTGSEDTLAFITEARLNITPLPQVRWLVNVKYDSFDSALRNAPFMVAAKALSVETIDSQVMNLAREGIVWHSVNALISPVPDKAMLGLSIVEFAGDEQERIDRQLNRLCRRLDELIAERQGGVIGYQVCDDLAGIERIYHVRKKAVGLLGNAKGQAKSIPFVEDTCVPPHCLADYIAEFRQLLDSHNLIYGMFGHVDAGVLHVMPALDLCDAQQEVLMKQISDRVVALTAKYGSLLWGEHGRVHSPKGRAALVREWLRLLSEQGVNPLSLEEQLPQQRFSFRTLIEKTRNSWHAAKGEYDFSHQVKEVMSGCLACKACSTQCPIKIDVPDFRSRFLQLYHTRYLRPLRDYVVAGVESYTPLMAKARKVLNFFLRQPWVHEMSRSAIGIIDLPMLSSPTLRQQLSGHSAITTTLKQLAGLNAAQRARYVLIVQDPFTSYYDAKVVADFVQLVEKLGFKSVLLPFSPNGKAQHINGFLTGFARTARHTSDILNRVAQLGMPLVRVDPALVLCYRDEYHEILGEKRGDFQVQLVHEWLQPLLAERTKQPATGEPWYLFDHCTETTAQPVSGQQWAAIFACFGAKLENVSVGCCGMAGTYGHEVKNVLNSRGIYQLSWHTALQHLPPQRCLATGYSCRSQIKRLEGSSVRHPLQALLEIIV